MSTGVLFVCKASVCRSPLAAGIFRRLASDRFRVDAAGIGSHRYGRRPHTRILELGRRHDLVLPARSREVRVHDLRRFQVFVAMDAANSVALVRLGARPSRLRLMLGPGQDVPDPYFGTRTAFEALFRLLTAASEDLLTSLLQPE